MSMDGPLSRRRFLRWSHAGMLACAGLSCALPACDWDGNFTIFGYTTAPNYDCKYKTVRVPIFQNKTLRRGLEFDLTETVVHEIEQKTPMKVVAAGQPADTELLGTIITVQKTLLNFNPLSEVREAQLDITIEIVWRDLHTGEILSRPGKRPIDPAPFDPLVQASVGNVPGIRSAVTTGVPALSAGPVVSGGELSQQRPSTDPEERGRTRPGIDPLAVGITVAPGQPPIVPVKITSGATFIPEVGQSTTSAIQQAMNKLAVQIVSLMEKPW